MLALLPTMGARREPLALAGPLLYNLSCIPFNARFDTPEKKSAREKNIVTKKTLRKSVV